MAQSQSTTNIVKEVPTLNQFEVEYEGNKFDCNKCREKDKCCGTEDEQFAFQLQCKKCRCQQLHDVTDGSRTGKVTSNLQCGDECNNNALDEQTCNMYGYLTNGLKANVMDCSNNLINVGANSTIEGVELRSKCTSTGGETAGVIKVNPNQSVSKADQSENMMIYAGVGGGLFLCIILLLMLMM